MLRPRFQVIQNETAVLSKAPKSSERFLLRQPVLDNRGHLIGHELRLRERVPVPMIPGANSRAQAEDEMLLTSVIDMAEHSNPDERLIFLPVQADTLANPLIEQTPRHKLVPTLQPPFPADAAWLEQCRQLAQAGFALALDDDGSAARHAPLLNLCRYLRIDISQHDAPSLGERVDQLRASSPAMLIATRVETEEAYAACRELPFELFQGWHFARLRPGIPSRLDAGRLRVIELLNLVISEAEIPQLETQFKCDAGLSYKLLRFINSPAIGLRQPVQSIAHALVVLGYLQLYRWLTLLLFVGNGGVDPRSHTLLKSALIRARLTENLGNDRLPPEQRGGLFIVGILSLLDALLNLPMAEAIADLTLPAEAQAALLHRQGPYAPYLELAIACENFDQTAMGANAEQLGLGAETINLAHAEALIWSDEIDG